jgi:RsiW-degrading membrane proteinase PrsW (M82 family)
VPEEQKESGYIGMDLTAEIISLLMVIFYSLLFSFSFFQKNISKRFLKAVLLGLVIGVFSGIIAYFLAQITHYSDPILCPNQLLYVPVLEEFLKLTGILLFVASVQKKLKFGVSELMRFGAGVGFGFGIFETFAFIMIGDGVWATIMRLLLAVPFHASTTVLLGYGISQRSVKIAFLMLFASILAHILTNFLAHIGKSYLDVIIFIPIFLWMYSHKSFQ